MKKSGFTLIELLAVIVILALLFLLTFPNIIKSIKKSNENTDNFTKELIINAAELYVKEHLNSFGNKNSYCIKLSTLVKEDYIDSPINDSEGNDMTSSKSIRKRLYHKEYIYEIIDNKATCK